MPEWCKLMVAFTVEGQKDAVGKSEGSLLSVLLELPEDHKNVKLKTCFLATCHIFVVIRESKECVLSRL